ncbi:MAG: hypothetical protein IID35_08830 [Planctomycetes bacterium]|nr:hypothetical protein [Planctomycetota bacterium]
MARATPFFPRKYAMVCLLPIFCHPSPARGDHERVSLDQKVRASDLIVIGTVSAIDDVEGQCPVAPPATSAAKVATIRIESVLKGRVDEETIKIGLPTDYRAETFRNEVRKGRRKVILEPEPSGLGVQYLLFLRELSPPHFAAVNWQYGALRVADGKVPDPRWPSKRVSSRFKSNALDKRRGQDVPHYNSNVIIASAWKTQIPLALAVRAVREAIELSRLQMELGIIRPRPRNTTAYVLFEARALEQRILVRMPSGTQGVHQLRPQLLLRGGEKIPAVGAVSVGSAPVSVDPLGVTVEATFKFPRHADTDRIVGVELTVRGLRVKVCMPSVPASECRSTRVRSVCPACRSSPAAHRVVRFVFDMIRNNNDFHCMVCGAEW